MALSFGSACGVQAEGSVECWGRQAHVQWGQDELFPTHVLEVTRAGVYTCALGSIMRIACAHPNAFFSTGSYDSGRTGEETYGAKTELVLYEDSDNIVPAGESLRVGLRTSYIVNNISGGNNGRAFTLLGERDSSVGLRDGWRLSVSGPVFFEETGNSTIYIGPGDVDGDCDSSRRIEDGLEYHECYPPLSRGVSGAGRTRDWSGSHGEPDENEFFEIVVPLGTPDGTEFTISTSGLQIEGLHGAGERINVDTPLVVTVGSVDEFDSTVLEFDEDAPKIVSVDDDTELVLRLLNAEGKAVPKTAVGLVLVATTAGTLSTTGFAADCQDVVVCEIPVDELTTSEERSSDSIKLTYRPPDRDQSGTATVYGVVTSELGKKLDPEPLDVSYVAPTSVHISEPQSTVLHVSDPETDRDTLSLAITAIDDARNKLPLPETANPRVTLVDPDGDLVPSNDVRISLVSLPEGSELDSQAQDEVKLEVASTIGLETGSYILTVQSGDWSGSRAIQVAGPATKLTLIANRTIGLLGNTYIPTFPFGAEDTLKVGSSVTITADVRDEDDNPVPDGTPIQWIPSPLELAPIGRQQLTTEHGKAQATFKAVATGNGYVLASTDDALEVLAFEIACDTELGWLDWYQIETDQHSNDQDPCFRDNRRHQYRFRLYVPTSVTISSTDGGTSLITLLDSDGQAIETWHASRTFALGTSVRLPINAQVQLARGTYDLEVEASRGSSYKVTIDGEIDIDYATEYPQMQRRPRQENIDAGKVPDEGYSLFVSDFSFDDSGLISSKFSARVPVKVRARYHASTSEIELRLLEETNGDSKEHKFAFVSKPSLESGEWHVEPCTTVSNQSCISPAVRLLEEEYQIGIGVFKLDDSDKSTWEFDLTTGFSTTIEEFEHDPLLGGNWKESGLVEILPLSAEQCYRVNADFEGSYWDAVTIGGRQRFVVGSDIVCVGGETTKHSLDQAVLTAQWEQDLLDGRFDILDFDVTLAGDKELQVAWAELQAAKEVIDEVEGLVDSVQVVSDVISWSFVLVTAKERGVKIAVAELFTHDALKRVTPTCRGPNEHGYVAPDSYRYVFDRIKVALEVGVHGVESWKRGTERYHEIVGEREEPLSYMQGEQLAEWYNAQREIIEATQAWIKVIGGSANEALVDGRFAEAVSLEGARGLIGSVPIFGAPIECLLENIHSSFDVAARIAMSDDEFEQILREWWPAYREFRERIEEWDRLHGSEN